MFSGLRRAIWVRERLNRSAKARTSSLQVIGRFESRHPTSLDADCYKMTKRVSDVMKTGGDGEQVAETTMMIRAVQRKTKNRILGKKIRT